MPSLQTGATVLDRHYIEIRHRLLDLAAALDRIDRAREPAAISSDARLKRIRAALHILTNGGSDRAERVQLLFSEPYDPEWR
ncbi:MAG TPA: hypothetical protein VGM03_04765 [Phycisphaerae bacterium]